MTNPSSPTELSDPCAIVHETYPNVGEDSCRWVLNVMRNFPPPTFLPAATDTGGPLMAARILTDTGELLFVASPVPDRFLGVPCTPWKCFLAPGPARYYITGFYCARQPVGGPGMSLDMFLNESLGLYQEEDRYIFQFSIYSQSGGSATYRLKDENGVKFSDVKSDPVNRILSGQFSAKLFNRRNLNDSIQLVDGRFDLKF